AVTENALGLCISAVIQHVRGVPEQCPACGSKRLSPERGYNRKTPGVEWERPTCPKCGWTGTPVPVKGEPPRSAGRKKKVPKGECVIPLPQRTGDFSGLKNSASQAISIYDPFSA